MSHLHVRILFLVFLLAAMDSPAQKLKQLLADGDRSMQEKDYFSAAAYYNRAILQDSADISIQYRYAEASRLNYDMEIADHWYTKVSKKDPQGKLYPDCVFWLATIRKGQGKYKDARKMFDRYAKKNKKRKDNPLVKKAVQEVAACDLAQVLAARPDKSVTVKHLDSAVNSKVSEYAPVQVDTTLYFSSLRNAGDRDSKMQINFNKVYSSKRKDSTLLAWSAAEELDTLFNRQGTHNANTAFSADMKKVYISRCTQVNAMEFTCEILYSEFKDGKWGALKRLPPEVNQRGSNNTQPAPGKLNGEDVLFFSSNRPGGSGGMDIWYVPLKADGSAGSAVNAGPKVNTVEDDITPYFCDPCQELFFSSTWHKGLGGFDIFRSEYRDASFAEPRNLGVPVNSSYNDIYFSINADRNAAFISSNRKGSYFEEKESCCNDIYMFRIPQIADPPKQVDSTQVRVTEMKLLVPLTLYFHNDEPDRKTLAVTTSKNYRKTCLDYLAMKDQYRKEYTRGASADMIDRASGEIDILFEDSVEAGLQDLEKFAALLKQVLADKEKVTITMKGYCSPLASTDYNVNLAKRRISSLRNFFMEYDGGSLVKYVNNPNPEEGSITFVEEEVGELKARPNVSDDYYDTRNSVYSPAAALERKIQIIAISTFSTGSK